MTEREYAVDHVDVIVVGAGPAGLSAAVTAADGGVRVALIDLNPRIGGQFWRHRPDGALPPGLHDGASFVQLRARLTELVERDRVALHLGQQVWQASAAAGEGFTVRTVGTTDPGESGRILHSRSLVIAAGAYDRQLPLPGWTLPGVVAAGGAQAMLKEYGTLIGGRVLVAGTGPFLLSVAAGLADAGAVVVGVCELNSPARWLEKPIAAVQQPAKAIEGVEYAAAFVRHRVPYLPRHVVTQIHGTHRVTGATIARIDRTGTLSGHRRVDVDAVALGWGFTPQLELVESLGARTQVDVDGSLVTVVDPFQRASVPGLYVAGESTGVGGAAKALAEGELAAWAALHDGGIEQLERSRVQRLQRLLGRARRFSSALHHASALPSNWHELTTDETVLCRCEEVTTREVRGAVTDLALDTSRDTKTTTRAGMGWCQGRECGLAVTCLTNGPDPSAWRAESLRANQKRPIATPVPLGHLAELHIDATEDHS